MKKCKHLFIVCLFLAQVSVVATACMHVEIPIIDESLIRTIARGNTDQEQIVKTFGIPDIIVTSESLTVPEGSIFHSKKKCFEKYKDKARKEYMAPYYHELDEFIESKRGHYLFDEWVTYIYADIFYQKKQGKGGGGAGPIIIIQNKNSLKVHFNELAVFFDKKTGKVVDYAYRKEWKWEDYSRLMRKALVKTYRPVENPYPQCSSDDE